MGKLVGLDCAYWEGTERWQDIPSLLFCVFIIRGWSLFASCLACHSHGVAFSTLGAAVSGAGFGLASSHLTIFPE